MHNDNLQDLTRLELARLGREYMAASQFLGRTGYTARRTNWKVTAGSDC